VRDASGNFTRFDAPNADEPIQFGTQSLSINAAGAVTGSFQDGSQFDKRRGFCAGPAWEFHRFDAPGSFPLGYGPQTATFSTSINAGGAVTGYFRDPTQGLKTRGFVRDAAGNITVFDAPDGLSTSSSSINAGGDVTGSFLGREASNTALYATRLGISQFSTPPTQQISARSAPVSTHGETSRDTSMT